MNYLEARQHISVYVDAAERCEIMQRALAMEIPGIVTFVREDMGLTQKEFAEKLGVSHTYVSKMEHGTSFPSVDFLRKFVSATT